MDFLKEAERIIAGQMQLVDYEGEYVATVSAETDLYWYRHYATLDGKRKFYGFNVYAGMGDHLKLLETCESKGLARNLVNSIRKGLAFGATWFRLPEN